MMESLRLIADSSVLLFALGRIHDFSTLSASVSLSLSHLSFSPEADTRQTKKKCGRFPPRQHLLLLLKNLQSRFS